MLVTETPAVATRIGHGIVDFIMTSSVRRPTRLPHPYNKAKSQSTPQKKEETKNKK